MLYKILLSLIAIILPAMAHAQIYSSVSATSNSGGNTAGQGGRVVTGDSSASVRVVTTGNSSSTSSVYIKTEANGTVHEESFAGDKGGTSVSVEATPQKTTIDVKGGTPPVTVKHEVVSAGPSGAVASTSASTTTVAQASTSTPMPGLGLGARIILVVQGFLAGLLSWFK